jgi:hypothetical protein
VVVSPENPKSGYILQPPQPLPHLQPDPHPQFPPQQDIFLEKIQIEEKFMNEN